MLKFKRGIKLLFNALNISAGVSVVPNLRVNVIMHIINVGPLGASVEGGLSLFYRGRVNEDEVDITGVKVKAIQCKSVCDAKWFKPKKNISSFPSQVSTDSLTSCLLEVSFICTIFTSFFTIYMYINIYIKTIWDMRICRGQSCGLCVLGSPVTPGLNLCSTRGHSRHNPLVHQRFLQGRRLQPEARVHHGLWQRLRESAGQTAGWKRFPRHSRMSHGERCSGPGSGGLPQTEDPPAGCYRRREHQEGGGVCEQRGRRARWAGRTAGGTQIGCQPEGGTGR